MGTEDETTGVEAASAAGTRKMPSMTNDTAGWTTAGAVCHCIRSPTLTRTDSGSRNLIDATVQSQ
jgi:hypothetical protein